MFKLLNQKPLGTPCTVPLLYKTPIFNLDNDFITVQKYYKPLLATKKAVKIYDRIVNFPCHSTILDTKIVECFEKLSNSL